MNSFGLTAWKGKVNKKILWKTLFHITFSSDGFPDQLLFTFCFVLFHGICNRPHDNMVLSVNYIFLCKLLQIVNIAIFKLDLI